MTEGALDRLLQTLDVDVAAFAVCEIGDRARMLAQPCDAVEIHYVLAGTLHLSVAGGEPMICPAGSVILVPAGLPQVMKGSQTATRDVIASEHCSTIGAGMTLFDAAEGGAGDVRLICGFVATGGGGSIGLLESLQMPIAEDLGDLGFVDSAFAMMLREIGMPGVGSRALIGSLMKTCLLMLLRRWLGRAEVRSALPASLDDPRLGRAVAAVLERPAGAHSVAGLAAIAGMSRSAFSRDFSAAFGLGPMEFVARTRLEQAVRLLRSTDRPIKVVAATSGFPSRSHFSRTFRTVYGTDPRSFRQARGTDAVFERPTAAPAKLFSLPKDHHV